MKTTVIAAADVRQIVLRRGLDALMDEMIERFAHALRQFDPRSTEIKVRGGFTYDAPTLGLIEWMPVLEAGGPATIKIVGYHPHNPDRQGLPTIISTIYVFDTRNGHLRGIIDGTFPTALRTGAASAVASRVLALPGSRVLGLIGCGAQAVSQFHALSRVFPLEEVRLFDIDPARVQSFESRVAGFRPPGVRLRAMAREEVVSGADILCTQTSVEVRHGPVFEDRDLQPHLHVNAVGSDFQGKTELPPTLLRRSFVCPDFFGQAVKEGECQVLEEGQVGPELSEVVKHPERYADVASRLSVFDSTGFALEDAVAARFFLECAEQEGVGSTLELESITADPWNPYGILAEHPVRP